MESAWIIGIEGFHEMVPEELMLDGIETLANCVCSLCLLSFCICPSAETLHKCLYNY